MDLGFRLRAIIGSIIECIFIDSKVPCRLNDRLTGLAAAIDNDRNLRCWLKDQ